MELLQDFEVMFRHNNSDFILTETVSARNWDYALDSLKRRFEGLQILQYHQV